MGQFVMQSTASHSGKLTAGTLEIDGNMTQAGANAYNFCTSGSHTVILNGTEMYIFPNPLPNESEIEDTKILESSAKRRGASKLFMQLRMILKELLIVNAVIPMKQT